MYLPDKVEAEGHADVLLAGVFRDEESSEVDGCGPPTACSSLRRGSWPGTAEERRRKGGELEEEERRRDERRGAGVDWAGRLACGEEPEDERDWGKEDTLGLGREGRARIGG
jgi:hypothetical protein